MTMIRLYVRGDSMITLYILYKLFFGGSKDSHLGFDAEEDDYEEMLIIGMLDDD